ncbi:MULTISPECIES: ABC transporter permease [unclassified Chelatococcus]|uniref:ABC transporter permease n=1 Tax=unclassified Chelatococcus TaxID=2638111 RepID=UPI001BCF46E3|nr:MULTISPECIES: ABC transporter permease [unclassified Chelatococcus]MBS7700298.1 ABC transporter permease [Chelatococcus sp. YT9]MBX3558269.1 ABC transporter permease [Chelatococcus sp.]
MSITLLSSQKAELAAPEKVVPWRLLSFGVVAAPLLFVLVFFFGPMIWLVLTSLSTYQIGSVPQLTFTIQNYVDYLGDPFYLVTSLWTTVRLALISTLFALGIGYVIAYYIAELPANRRGFLTGLVVVSLAVNIIIRIFGLNVLLMNNGLLNPSLLWLGVVDRPLRIMYTETGVLIGLVQIAVPYVVLPLIGVLAAIDPALKEAAASVGASPMRTFWNVTFPLSIPGIIAGSLIVFTLNAAAFAIPAMMGGGRVRMMGMLAYQQASINGNFPFAATVGICLFAMSLIITVVYLYVVNHKFKALRS